MCTPKTRLPLRSFSMERASSKSFAVTGSQVKMNFLRRSSRPRSHDTPESSMRLASSSTTLGNLSGRLYCFITALMSSLAVYPFTNGSLSLFSPPASVFVLIFFTAQIIPQHTAPYHSCRATGPRGLEPSICFLGLTPCMIDVGRVRRVESAGQGRQNAVPHPSRRSTRIKACVAAPRGCSTRSCRLQRSPRSRRSERRTPADRSLP